MKHLPRKSDAPKKSLRGHDEEHELPHKAHHRIPDQQQTLRAIKVGDYAPNIGLYNEEIDHMKDVLLGRVRPPINQGLLTLMEVADVYLGRALEMNMEIKEAEADGVATRGGRAMKFRTGKLKDFIQMAHNSMTMGSRRVSFETARMESERTGRSNMSLFYTEPEDED